MRTPATIALSVALTCATIQTSVSTAAAASPADGSITIEVIVREDVAEGEAPAFEVVETDLRDLAELLADPDDGVTVEPNGNAWITTSPADPEAINQWALAANDITGAWEQSTGDAGITIAVLDTGVDDTANLGDRRLAGASFVDGGDPLVDPSGHGSWVAALTAAAHDDVGIAGVCPRCTILPVQVGDQFGRVPWSAAAAGITWAVDQGADIINLSFGGGTRSQTLADAVAYAIANDVIVVAAAGNNGTAEEFYPAALDGVLSVAAHDMSYGAYSWSNRGAWVDVAGPGCSVGAAEGGYTGICGTSFAAPTVTGMIGLLLDVRGALAPDVVERVVETATSPLDYVETGWVDAARLLTVDPATFVVEPEPTPAVDPPSPFVDVDPDAYYAEPIAWLAATGATSGTSPTTFSPNDGVTRGQLATFLWRLEGEPEPLAPVAAFADVDPAAYYATAVAWLASTGATTGTSPTTFSPNDTVTRGQLATFLWRLDGSPRLDGATSSFTDVDPAAYYADPVAWMAEVGITSGTTPTTFSPNDTVTRGQLATFLWRRDNLGE